MFEGFQAIVNNFIQKNTQNSSLGSDWPWRSTSGILMKETLRWAWRCLFFQHAL